MFLYPIGRNTQDGALVSDAWGGRGATERSGCLLRPLLAVESAEICWNHRSWFFGVQTTSLEPREGSVKPPRRIWSDSPIHLPKSFYFEEMMMMNQWKKGRGTQFFLQCHVIWTGFTSILWHGNDKDSWTGDIGDVSSEDSCRSTGQTHISNHFNMFHNDLTSFDIVSFRSSSWKNKKRCCEYWSECQTPLKPKGCPCPESTHDTNCFG